jgi:hypothetical protein
MIEKTISDLEAKIQAASGPNKGELLQLLAQLRCDVSGLQKTSDDTRVKQKELQSSVNELRSSVEGFERSHPKLVQAIDNISNTLSSWGI